MGKHGGRVGSSVAERRASTTQVKRPTLQERGADATRLLREMLQLSADVTDTRLLGTAVAEAVAEEGRRNARFLRDIRSRYDELAALRSQPKQRQAQTQKTLEPLLPIRHMGYREVDPFAPPDPHYLAQLYGSDKLARALVDHSIDGLERAAAQFEQRHPGTKPKSRAQRQALIDYIVEQYNKEQGH